MRTIFRLGLILLFGLILCSKSAFAEYYWPNGIYAGVGGVYSFTLLRLNPTVDGTSGPILTKGKNKRGAAGFNVRLGYSLKTAPFHFDVAYNRIEHFNYDANPVFSTPSITYNNIDSKLVVQSLFVNGYYDMPFYNKLWPYVGIGVGPTSNKTSLTATNATGGTLKVTHTSHAMAFQGTVGFNAKILNNVVLYVAYHLMDCGKAQWGPWGSGTSRATLKSSELFVHQADAGIKIFLGNQTPSQPPELITDGE